MRLNGHHACRKQDASTKKVYSNYRTIDKGQRSVQSAVDRAQVIECDTRGMLQHHNSGS
jgi:hypothetical protein